MFAGTASKENARSAGCQNATVHIKEFGLNAMKEKPKTCKVCGKDFFPKTNKRMKISLKTAKGEKFIWVCPSCSNAVAVAISVVKV